MITWIKLANQTPEKNRELIAKNENKEVLPLFSGKKCKIMKFASSFSKEDIQRVMDQSEITHWAYTD